jgi:outer membrane protein insertion porin family
MMVKIFYDCICGNHNYLLHLRSIFLIFCFTVQPYFSQTIRSIETKGNQFFKESDYSGWIGFNIPSQSFPGIEDSIKSRISRGLRSEGYYDFVLSRIALMMIDSINQKIVIDVEEKEPTFINKIHFSCQTSDSALLKREFTELNGAIFKGDLINETIQNILTYYENNGSPFAKINIASVFFFKDSTNQNHLADIYIIIESGKKSSVDKIELSGNTKTKESIITRALGIKLGDKYNQEKIDEIPFRLNRLRFFEPVDPPEYYFNSRNEGILKINLVEKETNNFDGIIGFIPGTNGNEKGFFTGYINVNLRNLFGTGRAAAIKWIQENRTSQELEIKYLEPWILNFPINVEAGLFQRKQDSTYVQRKFEGKLEYIASEELSASIILNTQSTIPTERANNIFTVFNSSSFTSGINIKIDTRDDIYSPQSGIIFSNSYKFTSKKINGPAQFITPSQKTKVGFQRLEIDFSYYIKLLNEQIIAASVHARELKGDNLEISDLYLLGGTNTLRGFREKQFAGNRILWSNLEYRYLITRRSFAFVFFDSGYYLRNEDASRSISKVSEFNIGYGFGLNIETALGILGVSFALGKGDSFSDGKIHFGIVNEF